jgi:hypothetical protein
MKAVLGCLMCLVLTMSQSFAISGGPFSGPGHVEVTGTYAGVFVPTAVVVVLDPGPPPVTQTFPPDDSLALFTLKIPSTGLASGTAVIFRNGFFYDIGAIQGSADPDSAQLTGIINASLTVNVESGIETVSEIFFASGKFLNTKIVAKRNNFSTSGTRIRGKASITYTAVPDDPRGDSGGPIDYKVRGFKQSASSQ